MTHVSISEVGGIVGGEENSGRITLIPNAKLFEQNITNYASSDDNILNQVIVTITFESKLDKAIKIGLESAKKHTGKYSSLSKEPYVQTFFQANGINVHIRFFAPAKNIQEYQSKITQEVFRSYPKKNRDSFTPHRSCTEE